MRLALFAKTNAIEDGTFASVSLMTWSCVEGMMYLIASCLLTLAPIVGKLSISWLKTIGSKVNYGSGNSRSKGESGPHDARGVVADPARSGITVTRSGFIEMKDVHDKSGMESSVFPEPHMSQDEDNLIPHHLRSYGNVTAWNGKGGARYNRYDV